ncbi:pyrroline-5-carboxylate reductase [Sporosarcina sp. P37]|uniref:pyrroline-5-carboxylate reductase n=1 Tax=unclassified Sporosarcina TaxID=2647733 RepID=UPI0009BFDC64|nr:MULTISPECIES: pyrroline-5-carboxylate reductase [unclassified Sporosarcina]ARD46867.1 pyrroline-5-carboxylate reductase [Sporosarcina sp. P33]ARK23393.1 pyrroline-5-carboxylate reductase [Sporosarcina sp. P37]PID19648.1 pyrroline-5-carboxylate reductase [Sporosarcina sp. P35]
MEKILFVGAGSMAEAIIAGIVNKRVLREKNVYVMNRSDKSRLDELQARYGITKVCEDRSFVKQVDLVVLATKPKDIHKVMQDIQPLLGENTAILSVIAGVSIDTMEKGLGKRPIARSMPNTSATIGKSASGIAFNSTVPERMQQSILSLLNAIGIVKVVEEDDLHAVTALSGSGPAYIYYLVEALEEAAVTQGLDAADARELIVQTLEGAAAMLKKTGEEPSTLRTNVTSPGGTTAAGLKALENHEFKAAIADCIKSADERSRELGALS